MELKGTGTPPPTLTTSATELDFGNLATNADPTEQTYIITGTNLSGNVALTITGTDAAVFTITTSPDNTILSPEADGTTSEERRVGYDPTAGRPPPPPKTKTEKELLM